MPHLAEKIDPKPTKSPTKPEGEPEGDPEESPSIAAGRIVLVGMMGAGKSALGAALGQKLQRPWIDCDAFIEKEQGQSIKDIFTHKGEAAFRQMETAAVKKILATHNKAVISLGGGGFVNHETRKLCQENAITIWLKAKPQTILTRIGNDDSRPLLPGKEKERAQTIIALLKEREPFYQKATITIDEASGEAANEARGENNLEKSVQHIISKLEKLEAK